MAEAEEILTDAARHATIFARNLWHRHRERAGDDLALGVSAVAQRLGLLVESIFGEGPVIRVAQAPAPPTFLRTLFGSHRGPVCRQAVPGTDGTHLWLPDNLEMADRNAALQAYRTMALQQAMRARRGSVSCLDTRATGLVQDLYLLLEAFSADEALAEALPGTASSIDALRRTSLAQRPPLSDFPRRSQPLERFVRMLLQSDCGRPARPDLRTLTPADSADRALVLVNELYPGTDDCRDKQFVRLLKDRWTGQLLPPGTDVESQLIEAAADADNIDVPRSGRLPRRPTVRKATEQEKTNKDESAGAWMVQADQPHEKAEDPLGVQRPTDRDKVPDADRYGDMLSELPQARLVSTPGRPKDVLLTDDPPPSGTITLVKGQPAPGTHFCYPEWDYRENSYRDPGVTVRMLSPQQGPRAWVDRTLEEHRAVLELIRRRFEMLRSRRILLRRQMDGEDIDLDACVDGLADLRAGARLPQKLYLQCRPAGREIAVMLLVDVSGSTDGWIASHRRVIDVEREALLLVCLALGEMGEPYAVQTFSGEGPEQVTMRSIMDFDQKFGDDVMLRIAALEPERYTRAGAALRHATGCLMQQSANHRLLLLLSDGKPNDIDHYQGRYGVEDMRQAIMESRMQGIHPFCLTIDRQAADYLPRIFGANQYAMLPRSELLPTVLLDWMRRLLAARQT